MMHEHHSAGSAPERRLAPLGPHAAGETAHTLLVVCSESVAAARLVHEVRPVCTLANLGGAIVRGDATPVDFATRATLEWALHVERVSRIVLCGHSACRAHGGAGAGRDACHLAQAHLLAQWRALHDAGPTRALVRRGDLAVTAWWLDEGVDAVAEWDRGAERFVSLRDADLAQRIAALRAAPPRPLAPGEA